MHLEPGQIQQALDPEARERADPARHLDTCAECRLRLAEAEREEAWLRERLSALDHVPPRTSVRQSMSRPRKPGRSWERLAAGIFLALAAAGAAYAAPGSPLPALLRHIIGLVIPPPSPVEPRPSTDSPGSPAGIAVDPGDRLTVAFASPQPGDTAVVSLTHGREVVVKASGGTTTFNAQADHLVVRHLGAPGRFEILVPRDAPQVVITSGGQRLWQKYRSSISGPRTGTDSYLLPLSQNPASPAP